MTIKISDVVIKLDGKVVEPVSEKSYHYFGSTCFNWCMGESVEGVLSTLARQAGTNTIQQQVKHGDGLYAWVCRVEAPRSTSYQITNFQPQGVTVSESWEFNIKNSKGHCLPITREDDNVQLVD